MVFRFSSSSATARTTIYP